VERGTGIRRRHHLHEMVVQRTFCLAVLASGVTKRATCHTRGHTFATAQESLGHGDVSTTMIYTHVPSRGGLGVRSPLDLQAPE
jgi:integrase